MAIPLIFKIVVCVTMVVVAIATFLTLWNFGMAMMTSYAPLTFKEKLKYFIPLLIEMIGFGVTMFFIINVF